jgi:cob(I)alamin adenosyltransferase
MAVRDKSTVAITSIRTGNGDSGSTKLGGNTYRKSHPLVAYSAALDKAQSYTDVLPMAVNGLYARDMMQELLFRLGAVIGGRTPREQEVPVQEISAAMERHIASWSETLAPLDSFLRTTEVNADLQRLRAEIREAEVRCVQAFDYIDTKQRELSPNLLHGLAFSGTALNIASDWVFLLVWLHSVDPNTGKVTQESKWVPWSEERVRELNP